MRELALDNTQISDFSHLTALTGLRTLSLDNTQITNLSPLTALTRLRTLSLSNTRISDFSPLTALTGLSTLTLSNTQISDLSPLTSLTRLSMLWLHNTGALDLRPLCGLTGLVEKPEGTGLTFQATAATRADPRIAEIAKIEVPATRARELFAYLDHWVPPGAIPVPPKPDPLFETILINGQLELAADLPTQAERDEALKRALHERMKSAALDLARVAGNTFDRLASKARVLAGLLEKPFDELDLLSVHLEVEILQDRLTRGTEDDVAFPDTVLGPLSDVTRAGPGLTLGHPSVDLYIARVRDARENPSPAKDEASHAALSVATIQDPQANGPLSIAMEQRIAALEDKAERQAGWTAKHKWLVWVLGTSASLLGGLTVELIGQNFGVSITSFIVTNASILWDVALSYGAPFAGWFAATMAPVFIALGVEEEIVKRMKK